jgi:hypothetical protein
MQSQHKSLLCFNKDVKGPVRPATSREVWHPDELRGRILRSHELTRLQRSAKKYLYMFIDPVKPAVRHTNDME